MKEHIYTIPLNEHFGKLESCPLCSLFEMMEYNEVETITGASMMEPSVRIQTNKEGFCEKHLFQITQVRKKLPVALMFQSHLEELFKDIKGKSGEHQIKRLDSLEHSCYICRRIKANMDSIYSNFFHLYKNDSKFHDLFLKQKLFCLPHYKELLYYGSKNLSKKEFKLFTEELNSLEMKYLEELKGDIDWFCKKFDYRFAKEDWKNSRDAVERTIYTLCGTLPKNKSEE